MLPELVSDFRLLSRDVYLAISKMRESHRFLRGLGAWVGFRTTFIELERPPRFAGESKWLKSSLFSVIQHATKSIFSHSSKPLVWVASLGLILSLGSLLTIFGMSIVWLFGSVPFAGFGTIVGLISLGFSLTMLCIGILAQYLALIYEEVKQRPLYIVAEKTY
jgi:dolichol-phosphate mannosyltransferase